jgi:hypothetical protein
MNINVIRKIYQLEFYIFDYTTYLKAGSVMPTYRLNRIIIDCKRPAKIFQ